MLSVGVLGSALLTAATRAEAAAGGEKIRVGHMPAGCVSHLFFAKSRGLFEKAGLNVELSQFNGPSEALQALEADNLELIHSPWTMSVAAHADGAEHLRVIGGSGQAGIELVARKGSVANVDELIAQAGKQLRIGTLRLDTLELVGYGTLSKNGKSYDDYNMTFFNSMVGMGEALANGRIDVCTLAQPYAESVVKEAGGVYLTDSNSVWGPEAADCVITTKAGTVDSRDKALSAYLQVLKQAADIFNNDFETALDDLQPIYGTSRDVLRVALKRQFPNPVISPAGVTGLHQGVKYLIELGYLQKDNVDALLDLRYQPV
ncbi:ABC transporter substrate-binding protein [Advenella sp. RU8]|uniref:ABC transporter substrate-binding protein n=1 Tax=Advenella sp. RU8 TaxID=3399575 RepID=UPI003AAABF46